MVATPAVFSVAPLELNFEEAAVGGSMASRCQGYWERTGLLRAKVLAKGFRARLADALVAQWCLDHQLPLVSRDGDFRHFARWGGLKLVV